VTPKWTMAPLATVCEVKRGETITRTQTMTGMIPVIAGGLKPAYFHGMPNRPAGAITVSGSGANAGSVAMWDEEIWASDCSTVISKNPELLQKFVFYFLKANETFIKTELRQGAAQPHVYAKDIAVLEIPLPPLDEQKRIVAKLDEALGYVDSLIDNLQKSMFQVNEFSKSAVSEVIEKQVVDLGSVRMDEVFTIARGGSPRPIKKFLTQSSDGINWIKISDASRTGKYITDTTEKILKEGISRSRFVKSGDLLLSNSMSFGRPYILKTDGCIHDGWLVLSSKRSNVDTEFMYYLLGSQYVYRQFDDLAAGSTVRNLNKELVASVKIPLPTIDLQKSLTSRFQDIELANESLLSNINNRLMDAEILKNSILSAAFAGDF
jgi:restriction endonuclease S subunit